MLLAAGLSTEHIESSVSFGPPIPEKSLAPQASDPEATDAAALIRAYADAATAGFKMQRGTGAQAGTYHLAKTQTSYRFCFLDPGPESRGLLGQVDPALFCNHARDRASGGEDEARGAGPGSCSLVARSGGNRPEAVAPAAEPAEPGRPDSGGNATFNFSLQQGVLRVLDDRLSAAAKASPDAANYAQRVSASTLIPGAISFKLQVRSTEGILYYLGEVLRRHLYPESSLDSKTRLIQMPTRVPRGAMPESACHDDQGGRPVRKTDLVYLNGKTEAAAGDGYFCENLFVVDTNSIGSFISVSYDGTSYGLSGDRERTGRTYQVLELAKQLMALNTSAKQLPSTSVLVISQPQ
jgi:hypothetical protein